MGHDCVYNCIKSKFIFISHLIDWTQDSNRMVVSITAIDTHVKTWTHTFTGKSVNYVDPALRAMGFRPGSVEAPIWPPFDDTNPGKNNNSNPGVLPRNTDVCAGRKRCCGKTVEVNCIHCPER